MQEGYQSFDINKLCKDAQTRWLKPVEVLFILHNHESFQLSNKPPDKPPSGSLLLFNRRVLRNYRNDGYLWRKKNNGRTLAESHEHLKVGAAEVLSCYYARGEQNPCFQRRIYWMLDPANEHIVFVHYRDVAEGRFVPEPIFSVSTESPSTFNQTNSITDAQVQGFPTQINELNEQCQNPCSSVSVEEASSEFVTGKTEKPLLIKMDTSETYNQPLLPEVNHALRKLEEQLSLDDDDDGNGYIYSEEKLHPSCNQNEKSEDLGILNHETRDFVQETLDSLLDQLKHEANDHVEEGGQQDGSHALQMVKSPEFSRWSHGSHSLINSTSTINSCGALSGLLTPGNDNNTHGLETVLLTGNSVCSSSGADFGLPVAQKPWFNICEISPEWAFSFERTKVIITGHFLCNPPGHSWAILFGDAEVPLEIVQEGVFRCLAPKHDPGKVKLRITSGNGEPCSDVREFEFRANPGTSSFSSTSKQGYAVMGTEELLLLVRFVQLLLYGHDRTSIPQEGDVETCIDRSRKLKRNDDRLGEIVEALLAGRETSANTMDWILQELLKDKLQQWLLSKHLENADQTCVLSKQEQCIIHMISGLGYEWALNPILTSGTGINFRDTKGWTALHWAACFGREKMVAALLAAGASAGAVTDPTPQEPAGKTPGSLAAANDHKGLAGYLSEAALTNHLFSLAMGKSEISKTSGPVEADGGVESISQRSAHLQGGTEDQLLLKDSLAAVRNATQAAARIQSTFRAYSFWKKHQNADQDKDGFSPEDINGVFVAFRGLCDRAFHKAALSIQKNYRCWKRRKEFVTLRKHVIKIQARVRAHQARKKYELLLTVGILEKIILRWCRRRVGLRGFRADPESINKEEENDILKVFRKQKVDAALDEAVSSVLSMVDCPEAQQQYRRMLESYRQAKADLSKVETATSRVSGDWVSRELEDYLNQLGHE
ncbi:calmodulin-binding transcription activator 4 isoform X2 [Elaeis guineensis]|uniref:Calmodulin-binding transcription activator 4 isoform X1 n=1 Tax=Elaeis guineensis var. tenera TaxID=51953 RepID=A0A6I9RII6_ELAGV|nr:calmodulin-binding transcription activator 4 isoform X1 [Elaeis guineensis]